jgi:hypothetical protein
MREEAVEHETADDWARRESQDCLTLSLKENGGTNDV